MIAAIAATIAAIASAVAALFAIRAVWLCSRWEVLERTRMAAPHSGAMFLSNADCPNELWLSVDGGMSWLSVDGGMSWRSVPTLKQPS